jgi:lysozyme
VKTSQSAINKLKATEQFRSKAYNDPVGSSKYSIGYGHQIQSNETSLLTASISTSTADTLFKNDTAPLEAQLNAAKYPFNQNQFDALLSFGYNTGSGSLALVIKNWNTNHDPKKVTAEMAAYTKVTVGGLKQPSSALEQRRASEILTFLEPKFPVLAVVGLASLVALYALSR